MKKILHNPKKAIQSFCILSLMLLFSTLSWGQTYIQATAGTYNWICPAGVTSIQVECWGGGGGGAGASSSTNLYSGGGGAGGNYVKQTSVTVVPGQVYTIVVGAGGAGGGTTTTAGFGGNGGATYFNGTTTLLAVTGGSGGNSNGAAYKTGFGGKNGGALTNIAVTTAGSYSVGPTAVIVGTPWTASTTYYYNQQITNGGKLYTVTAAGTTGTMAPTHISGSVTDGTSALTYAGIAATATISKTGTSPNITISYCAITNAGSGYLVPPNITIIGGTSSVAGSLTAAINPFTIVNTGPEATLTYYLGGNGGGEATYTVSSTTNASGGGGGSAGTAGPGNNGGTGISGGALAVSGGGAGAAGLAGGNSTSGTLGVTATDFGGGGGGATGITKAGGAGAAGKIIITHPKITTSGTLLGFTTVLGTASASQTFTLSGENMSTSIIVTAPSGFEVSTDNTAYSNTLTIGTSGTISSTIIYIRIASNAAAGNYNGLNIAITSTNSTSVNIPIPNSAVTTSAVASVSISATSLGFFANTAVGSSSAAQNFIVTGNNLNSNAITITAPVNFQISTNSSSGFGATTTLIPSSGSVTATTIYARYSPTGTGLNAGNIVVSQADVSNQNISVSGAIGTFYYQSGSIATTTNWNALPNGTGDNPTNFSTDGITYKILNNATTTSTWTVSGIGSKVVLGDSGSSAVSLTIANGFPIIGTIDITAASSGSNSLVLQDPSTYPTFGLLNSSSEVHFQAANVSPASPPVLTPSSITFGKVFFENNISYTLLPTISIQTALNLSTGSTITVNSSSYLYFNSNATASLSGTIRTSRASGIVGFNIASPNTTNQALQFQGFENVGTSLVLNGGTIEYSRGTSGTTQIITPRSDYNNLVISGDNNIKTLAGNTTVFGILTLNMTSSTATPVVISSLNTGNNNLTLNTAASAVFGPASVLNISGGITDFGGRPVTLQSTAAGTARIATILGTLTGATNVTVERYIPAKRAWRALTAPLKGSNSSIFSTWQNNGTVITGTGVELWSATGGNGLATGPGNSILQYDNSATGAWSPVTNTNTTNLFTLSGNNAFMLFPTGSYGSGLISSSAIPQATTLKATGQLITGNVDYTGLSNSSHTLIGNPYASPIDLNSILDANASLEKYFWVWDPNGTNSGTYNTFDATLNTYSVTNVSYTNSTVIQSGQAFFVKALSGQSGSFTITEANKSALTTSTVFKTTNTDPELLRVNLQKQENNEWLLRDATLVGFFTDAEATQTANKMSNGTENIAFTKNGNYFASEHHLPLVSTDTLNVRIWKTTAGANYKLKINTEQFTTTGLDATLQDLYTNSNTPLSLDGTAVEYPFTVTSDATSSGDRFRIVFSPTLGTHNVATSSIKISPNPIISDSFQVSLGSLSAGNYDYFITNSIGQEIEKGTITHNEQAGYNTVKMRENVAAGIYIVKIIGADKSVYTTKLIKQ